MKHILLSLALSAAVSLSVSAQQQKPAAAADTAVNRTVVVEQEYTPTIRDAGKVNVMPQAEPPSAVRQEVSYDLHQVPARQVPASLMPSYTLAEPLDRPLPGYVRAGYGNYGNLDLAASYLFTLSAKDRLDVRFALEGMNGTLDCPDDGREWDARYYRTRIGAGYRHDFDRVALEADGRFGLSNFNFLPNTMPGHQKFSSGGLRVGVRSTDKELPLQFRAETGLTSYSRRRDGFPLTYADNKWQPTDHRETRLHTEAEAGGVLTDESRVGVALAMDNFFYNNEEMESHTTLQLNPYYDYRDEAWNIRLGAHVDPAFGFARKLRVAPDVKAEYTFADSYRLYLQARGGRLHNDFTRLEALSPYAVLTGQPLPTYEQVNAAVGFRAAPADGLHLHLFAGYQNLKDDAALAFDYLVGGSALAYDRLLQQDTQNAYAGLEASYEHKDLFRLSASGTYRHWRASGDSDWLMLPFKPAFESELQAEVRPLAELRLLLGHRFVRREKPDGCQDRAASVSNLYLQARYDLFHGVGIYLQVRNLLDRRYQEYPSYPVEGINFVGGVTFRF